MSGDPSELVSEEVERDGDWVRLFVVSQLSLDTGQHTLCVKGERWRCFGSVRECASLMINVRTRERVCRAGISRIGVCFARGMGGHLILIPGGVPTIRRSGCRRIRYGLLMVRYG